MPTDRAKVAILTNMVAPYRRPLFERLGERLDLHVLLTGFESNRPDWRRLSEHGRFFQVHPVRGLQLSAPRRCAGATIDRQRIHLNPALVLSLAKLRPDAVVTAEMGFRSLSALLYGRLARKPVWVWWGGTLHTEREIGPLRRAIRRAVVRFNPRWISYGQTSTEYLRSLGVAAEHILTIQNTVDEGAFLEPTEPSHSFEPRPAILTVGQLIPRKGLSQLLGAAHRLWDRGHRFSLVLAGSGPERERLVQSIQRGREALVHFVGSVPPESMPGLYRSCDAFLFPTLEDVWGLAVNEAILCGLPVACSKFAGCAPELVAPEAVFDPTDDRSIEDALERAVRGTLPPAVPSRVWPISRVAEAISGEILTVVGGG
ncbi:MAG: glycosyltransferase [Armatimonadetes bacterium]|nr:glycosyltransferase [Armatimonadota bacterium]